MIKNLILGIVILSLFSCGTSVDLTPIALPKDKIEMLGNLGPLMEISSDTEIRLKEGEGDDILISVPIRLNVKPGSDDYIELTVDRITSGCADQALHYCGDIQAILTFNNSQGLPVGGELILYDEIDFAKALESKSQEFNLEFITVMRDDERTAGALRDISSAAINILITKK